MTPQRIVLFVEGEGDAKAAPVLLGKIITEAGGWDCAQVDPNPFRIGDIGNLTGRNAGDWIRWLRAAAKRKDVGGILLLLDGDADRFNGKPFCPVEAATTLANTAREAGAGDAFSLAIVFACMEFESWLLAGIGPLAGKAFPSGANYVKRDASPPAGDLERAPRDAKKALGKLLLNGYSPPLDQEPLTRMVDLPEIRKGKPRSFLRLDSAVAQLLNAFRRGHHVVSPK